MLQLQKETVDLDKHPPTFVFRLYALPNSRIQNLNLRIAWNDVCVICMQSCILWAVSENAGYLEGYIL